MKQNDWLILGGVILLFWWLSRQKETVTTNISYPNARYNADGSYAGDTTQSTRESGGDYLDYIIDQQSNEIQNF